MANAETADLMGIGAHCSVSTCRQKDFLPFKCSGCGATFCLEHRTFEAHQCPNRSNVDEGQAVVCPLCARAIKLSAGQTGDEAFEAHTRSGACDPSNYSRVHHKKSCPVGRCREKLTTLNRYRCKRCGLEVCMAHRLPGDHGCDERIAEAKRTVSGRWSALWAARSSKTPIQQDTRPSAAGPSSKPGPQRPSKPVQRVNPTRLQGQAGQQQKRESCRLCGARFSDVQQLTQHIRDYHPAQDSRQDRNICPRCGRQFSDVVALIHHAERGCRDPKKSVCILA